MSGSRLRYSAYGAVSLVLLALLVLLSLMQFDRDFDTTDTLHLRTPRAGLLLDAGSPVKLRGVTIGRVSNVAATAGGARLDLAMDPAQLHLVPANARAHVVPPTMFGTKYVELLVPPDAHGSIRPGTTLTVDHVTVEIDNTFQHLMELLDATQPSRVDAALSALATALQGRGDEAGRLLEQIDQYLRQINPELPGPFRRDLPLAQSVLGTYADAAPALLRTAANLSRTSDSILANRASLDAFLLSITTGSRRTTTFVQQHQRNLGTTLDVLDPVSKALARYAPEFPCFFQGLYKAIPLAEAAVGGKQPGLGVLSQFLPPEKPYSGRRDLPKIGADVGPRCYGLPNIPMGTQIPHQNFDVGPDPYASDSKTGGFDVPTLIELLFGPVKGASS